MAGLKNRGASFWSGLALSRSYALMPLLRHHRRLSRNCRRSQHRGSRQIIGLREGQSPAWAETRPSRGSGAPHFAVTYGPTPRLSRGGTPKLSVKGDNIAST